MRVMCVLALSIALLSWTSPVRAQQAVDYASISGRVVDSSGAAIQGAQVAARQTETNVTSSAMTDQEGRFRFPYLRIGAYELTINQPGFREEKRGLTLTAGSAFDVPVALSVAGFETSFTVTGEAPILEAARSQITSTVSQPEVDSLPMNGRQFLDLALLVPGVAPANVASTQLFPETSAVPGVSLSIGSQRNLSNNFIVDGLSANDDAAALSGLAYSVDAVEQLQVVTSGGQAELGRALGGYVNVVTKSGTNALRGTVYDYFRDDRLNAANALSDTRLPMDQSQYGVSLGGPIVRNRTFYFANLEQRRLDQTGLVTIADGTTALINAKLAASGYAAAPVATGIYPNPVDSTNVLARIDHQISGQDQLSVRYSLYDVSSTNSRGAGGLAAPSASSALDNLDQAVAASNTLALSARAVLETRAQFNHGDLQAPPTDPLGPAVAITGVATFGRLSSSPTGRVNSTYQVVNNLSYQAGAHSLRGGVDFLSNDDRIVFPRAVRGTYTFQNLATFLAGTYNNAGFTQTFGVTEVSQFNPNVGIYAQDEWKISSGLTLNAGIRYDLQFLETVATDADNISPRIGIAWSPFDSQTTVIRANAGLFYDRVPLRAVANALLSANNTTDLTQLRQTNISLSPTQAGAPIFPNLLPAAVPSVTLPNLTTMDRHLQSAYSRQFSTEIERQLGTGTTISVGYQYLRGLNLLMSINQNVATCVAAGTNNGCRPNPAYANNSQYSSAGESNYHGMHVSFLQRPTRWGSYRVSYTLSKSMNNVGEFFFSSPIDPTDVMRDWGRSDDDQRHRFVVNGIVQTPMTPTTTIWQRLWYGFDLSGTIQAYSALPLNITSGVTSIQGTTGRPLVSGPTPTPLDVHTVTFIPRNSGIGSDFFSLNLRVSRAVQVGRVSVEGMAEAFNLTNRMNVVTRNANFGSGAYPSSPAPTFGQITAVSDPRSVQFGIRARF